MLLDIFNNIFTSIAAASMFSKKIRLGVKSVTPEEIKPSWNQWLVANDPDLQNAENFLTYDSNLHVRFINEYNGFRIHQKSY